jgi:dihydroorotate dehydrogenase
MYEYVRPLLFRLDPEAAHTWTMRAARLTQAVGGLGAVESTFEYEDDRLQQTCWGTTFENPVGLAAGFDKNAELIDFWAALGFGFAEVGSVTARPADGNPSPRAFRLPDDEALINRLGLNNDGAPAVARHLEARDAPPPRPVGINLAKTHDASILGDAAVEDFCQSFRLMAPHADYVVLNVSCPNTEDGTTFEEPRALDTLLDAIMQERDRLAGEQEGATSRGRPVPVLVKWSPPVSDQIAFDSRLDDAVAVAEAHGVDGYVATNTAPDRKNVQTDADRLASIGEGGLSGPPLEARATHLVRYLYRLTDGRQPIIGVGGVASADAAYRKIRAGASLVELYTGLVYEGPGLVRRIKQGLVERLNADGLASIQEAVGADVEAAVAA